MFGAVTLIILSGIKDLEEVMHTIEWSTLLFFAGLFVMVKVSILNNIYIYIIWVQIIAACRSVKDI